MRDMPSIDTQSTARSESLARVQTDAVAPDAPRLPHHSTLDKPHIRIYCTYMANKTISLPDDVLPIIESLEVPFSSWVASQLRHHAATNSGMDLGQQLLADAQLAGSERPTRSESQAALDRMERSAPW